MFIVTPGRRDRDRSDQLWASAGRAGLSRRNPQDHQGADQVSDLQPPSLRSHRRRRTFKKAGATVVAHRRATERLKALKGKDVVIPDEVGGRQAHHQARRHHARSSLHRPQPFRLVAGDVPAEGEDHLRGRLQLARRGAVAARGQRFLSDRMGSLAEEDSRARTGSGRFPAIPDRAAGSAPRRTWSSSLPS